VKANNYLKHQFTWKIDEDNIPDVVKDDPQPPI